MTLHKGQLGGGGILTRCLSDPDLEGIKVPVRERKQVVTFDEYRNRGGNNGEGDGSDTHCRTRTVPLYLPFLVFNHPVRTPPLTPPVVPSDRRPTEVPGLLLNEQTPRVNEIQKGIISVTKRVRTLEVYTSNTDVNTH